MFYLEYKKFLKIKQKAFVLLSIKQWCLEHPAAPLWAMQYDTSSPIFCAQIDAVNIGIIAANNGIIAANNYQRPLEIFKKFSGLTSIDLAQ